MPAGAQFFVRSGKGDGMGILYCAGCGDSIAQYERCYEMFRPGVASLHLHDECFTASGQALAIPSPSRSQSLGGGTHHSII
jgi:hypothetical protein